MGYALTERLCSVYRSTMNADWMEQGVLDDQAQVLDFIPGSPGRTRRWTHGLAVEKGDARPRGGRTDRGRADCALRRDPPEVIEAIRVAADELRAELAGNTATFVVNRNINIHQRLTVGCAFCGFGRGRRSPDAYESTEEEFIGRVEEAVEFGATRVCMQGGIHPELDPRPTGAG